MNKGHTFEYTFTVFTPTYNRAHLLVRLYESLKQQTFRDFEWVIVDDGSSDSTPELVRRWQTEAYFPIRYFWQPNSGKHVAYNRGLLEARGFLFADIDSDDFYVPEALERFYYYWSRIPREEQEQFAGVIGHFADMNSKRIIGTLFPQNFLISDGIEIRLRYRVRGDKIGANRIEVLRQFPFPEDLGRFVPEALVGNRIYQRYKQLFFNEVVAYKTYLRGGLSDRNVIIRASSPKAARTYYREFVSLARPIPFTDKFKNYANYMRFSLHAGVPLLKAASDVPSKILAIATWPLGWSLFVRDLWVLRRSGRNSRATH